jgi:hypothetical protein
MSSSAGETEAALVALLHLIRLMGAELVAGQHRDDVEVLVKAVETCRIRTSSTAWTSHRRGCVQSSKSYAHDQKKRI